VPPPTRRRVDQASGHPVIDARHVLSPNVQRIAVMESAPDDHFDARPNACMQEPSSRRSRRWHPTVSVWIVPPTRICNVVADSCPNNHFTPGPNCRMAITRRRRVRSAGSHPTIRNWSVFSTGVNRPIKSTPDDHFSASPNSRVVVAPCGRVRKTGGCPTVCAGIIPPAGV
jgi:hypothetical protein